jgi:hypothetical protein
MDLLIHRLDPKVESTSESADRLSHLDSHARPSALSPTRACLPFTSRPYSVTTRPAPTVSPRIPVPHRTPGAGRAHVSLACACGSAIFQDFTARSSIFDIMAQSFFDFVSHFWDFVTPSAIFVTIAQWFFEFRQPFFEMSSILVTQPFFYFVVLRRCESTIFWFINHHLMDLQWLSHFYILSAIFWDFVAHSAIFVIMARSFFDFISYFWVFVHALSVAQLFFRFCHALNHFCYNGSVIF